MSRALTLPEELLLLAHRESGKLRESTRVAAACAVAELGELALRGRLLVRFEESALPGLRFFRFEHAVIELLAAERTGLWWADHLLAELLQRREAGPIPLDYKWVRRHHDALPRHRAALAHRGLLRVEPATGLTRFIARERHRPDTAVRDALIAELRAPTAGRRALDARLLFLSDLVAAVGLHGELGISDRAFPRRMNPRRGIGVVTFRPEAMRDTSFALASAVPTRSGSDGGGGDGGDGGGDGGGGGGGD